jgi:hypothetical protein
VRRPDIRFMSSGPYRHHDHFMSAIVSPPRQRTFADIRRWGRSGWQITALIPSGSTGTLSTSRRSAAMTIPTPSSGPGSSWTAMRLNSGAASDSSRGWNRASRNSAASVGTGAMNSGACVNAFHAGIVGSSVTYWTDRPNQASLNTAFAHLMDICDRRPCGRAFRFRRHVLQCEWPDSAGATTWCSLVSSLGSPIC